MSNGEQSTGTSPDSGARSRRTVVVCGVGAVTAHGDDVTALWEGVKAGRSAIGPVRGMPMEGYGTEIGGEVSDPRTPAYDYLASFGGHEPEPAVDFALVAAQEAMRQAGLGDVPGTRWGWPSGRATAVCAAPRSWRAARTATRRATRTTGGTTCWCRRRP